MVGEDELFEDYLGALSEYRQRHHAESERGRQLKRRWREIHSRAMMKAEEEI